MELAGALSEIAQHTLKHDFRRIRPEHSRILLVEAAPKVLSHYPDELCERAAEKIRKLGIEIHVQTKVIEITPDHVRLSSSEGESIIATQTVLWGAGVRANSLGRKLADSLQLKTDRGGRIAVTPSLQIAGHENIYVIGDLASAAGRDGKPLPGLASVAVQQGGYVARSITANIREKPLLVPFEYKDRGTMATIGRNVAVAEVGKYKFAGYFAWLLWLFVHLMLIVQFQNRLLILTQWSWSYFTFNRSNRIITGRDPKVVEPAVGERAVHALGSGGK